MTIFKRGSVATSSFFPGGMAIDALIKEAAEG
jgi:hypothetical protein